MILLLADSTEPLTAAVARELTGRRVWFMWWNEQRLFADASFSLRREGREQHGCARSRCEMLQQRSIRSVFLRLPRLWWPDDSFQPWDQLFVFHETCAAWFEFLTSLPCHVVNRLPLDWWLHDLNYPVVLRWSLARRLGLATECLQPTVAWTVRLEPTATPDPDPADRESVFMVGGQLVAAQPGHDRGLVQLAPFVDRLRVWQRDHQIPFARLDLTFGDRTRLVHVEPYPLVARESPATLDRIAAAIAPLLL